MTTARFPMAVLAVAIAAGATNGPTSLAGLISNQFLVKSRPTRCGLTRDPHGEDDRETELRVATETRHRLIGKGSIMSHPVLTLELPEDVYERVRLAAKGMNQPVEKGRVADIVQAATPSLEKVPAEYRAGSTSRVWKT